MNRIKIPLFWNFRLVDVVSELGALFFDLGDSFSRLGAVSTFLGDTFQPVKDTDSAQSQKKASTQSACSLILLFYWNN